MDEEENKVPAPVSEVPAEHVEGNEEQDPKVVRQVPLEALEAERRKRQDAEAQARAYQELAQRLDSQKTNPKDEDSEEDYESVTKGELKQFYQKLTKEEFAEMKRDIAEETFKESNPDKINMINKHLKEILERKPWLADSIQRAPNRYARAYEVVQDYMPQVTQKQKQASEVKKIVENSQKPGSPVTVGKSAQMSGADYLKSIAGTKEFRDYRKQLLGR